MMWLPLMLAIQTVEGDAEIALRLQRRDPQALAELYDRYGGLAYALILRIVQDAGLAEDLLQETFLRVWNRVRDFDARKGSIGPWLLALARNCANGHVLSAGERDAPAPDETDHRTPEAAPSAKLRRRILASVCVEQKKFGWAPFLAATTVLCLTAAVYFGGRERDFAALAMSLREQMRGQSIELTRLNEAFAIVNSPATVAASFAQGPKGRVFVNPAQGVLLIASNLPPAPTGRTYQMWILPKQGKPVPAGLFQAQPDGTAMQIHRGTYQIAAMNAIAVTIESENGSDQPTSQPLIFAPLPQ
jgi:RNA polymerase sigma factor (sigma-70 family)